MAARRGAERLREFADLIRPDRMPQPVRQPAARSLRRRSVASAASVSRWSDEGRPGPTSLAASRAQAESRGAAAAASFRLCGSRGAATAERRPAAAAARAQLVPIRVGAALDFGGYHPLTPPRTSRSPTSLTGSPRVLLRWRRRTAAGPPRRRGGAHSSSTARSSGAGATRCQPACASRLALTRDPRSRRAPLWVEDIDPKGVASWGRGGDKLARRGARCGPAVAADASVPSRRISRRTSSCGRQAGRVLSRRGEPSQYGRRGREAARGSAADARLP